MSDIVQRLRSIALEEYDIERRPNFWSLLCDEAADEIERLQALHAHDWQLNNPITGEEYCDGCGALRLPE